MSNDEPGDVPNFEKELTEKLIENMTSKNPIRMYSPKTLKVGDHLVGENDARFTVMSIDEVRTITLGTPIVMITVTLRWDTSRPDKIGKEDVELRLHETHR